MVQGQGAATAQCLHEKRPTTVSKETLLQCQKRPTTVSKEQRQRNVYMFKTNKKRSSSKTINSVFTFFQIFKTNKKRSSSKTINSVFFFRSLKQIRSAQVPKTINFFFLVSSPHVT